MRSTGFWSQFPLALIVIGVAVSGPSCASTKNVMNKATFGLVGAEDDAARDQKRAAKEQEDAEKQAAKEQKKAETDRGFLSKATFGLAGGESEEKAAKKEAKREAEAQKKAEKQAAKEQKKADKQAREQEKQMANAPSDRSNPSDSQDEPKRGFMSKATFGLVGGDSEEKAAKKEAKRQAEEQKKAEKQAAKEQKTVEKQAREQEKQMANAQSDQSDPSSTQEEPKRGFMSKATFGLVGGDSEEKAAKKEAKRQADEQKKAEKQARKDEKQMAKAQTDSSEPSDSPEKPKRSLMSKLSFGLVGNDGSDNTDQQTVENEMPVSTPEPPVAMPAGDSGQNIEPASAMGGDAQKLAKLPFETEVSYDALSASGKQQAVASRVTYSKHGYGITDLGDVRIAVRDMTFSGGTRGGRIIISSEDRAKAAGTAGIGNETFAFDYAKGVTACTFGTIQFTIATGVIMIDDQSVPMGQGHKLVVVDAQGNVEGVYAIQ
jgi:hypothetical protein